MIYIILNSLIISAWCLGFRTITDEGMLLYWMRKHFENINSVNKAEDVFLYLMKPILLCVVCLPSIHGTIIYYLLHGWQWQMIISITFSCFINSFVWNLYEKIRQ